MKSRLTIKAVKRRRKVQGTHIFKATTASGQPISSVWKWLERLVLFATFSSFIAGAVVFIRNEDDRELARLEKSWTFLYEPSARGMLASAAINRIAKANGDFSYVDLSCRRWADESGDHSQPQPAWLRTCLEPLRLSELIVEYDDPFAYLGFKEADFSGSHVQRSRFRNVNLRDTVFEKAFLSDVVFHNATATKIGSMRGSRLSTVVIKYSRIWSAQFQGATIEDMVVERTNFALADFTESFIWKARFNSVNLSGSVFSNVNLEDVRFENVTLHDVDFTGAQGITSLTFSNAWAFSTRPPKGIDLSLIRLCDPRPGTADDRSPIRLAPSGKPVWCQ
ncbi:pentapeptide repeat-containing protein [uncultured Tateyamaria sp.]|uniref:pentapeptide repeat-containing protein n=1 Tax=uncultured Tateyamaria sp. TaxID=455651 RepID=UPI00261D0DC6|nr:pentapeptide repeat-containing protein [uncultured Tateyamaria sp.]